MKTGAGKPVRAKSFTEAVRTQNAELFQSLRITAPARFEWYVRQAMNGRNFYRQLVADIAPKMPWWFLACVHGMECSFDFERHLHNGDPLARRTRNVPAGRPVAAPANGRAYTFAESARDALTMRGKELHLVSDWSVEHALWLLERFNGLGYRNAVGIHSPYLYAGTSHYSRGKFVRDHVYSATAVSKQAGCAGLIKLLFDK